MPFMQFLSMNAPPFLEYDWPYLLTLLPSSSVLDQTAKMYGAITRKRNIDSSTTLLRLAFAYGFCGMSLRQTSAWAQSANIASLSDVALLKRLRSSHVWLGHVLGLKLAERAQLSIPLERRKLRLVDATTISRPGSTGTDWRVHLGFDLESLSINHIELTDYTGGETLKRFPIQRGEVVIADRGYAHRAGLHRVFRTHADFLVRYNWQNTPLQQTDGTAFDLFTTLRGVADAQPREFRLQVVASKKESLPAFPVRLLVIRKSDSAAEQARRKVIHEHSRKSKGIDPRTLELAGYCILLTSLSPEQLSLDAGLELYRFRWQIELAFKRLKSLLELDSLSAKDPPLARCTIYAKLLGALLTEELTDTFLSFSPWGYRVHESDAVTVANTENSD